MAEPIPYPKWLYRHDESKRTCIVATPAEESALKKEAGWFDTPPAPPPPEPPPPTNGATDHAPKLETAEPPKEEKADNGKHEHDKGRKR